MIQGEGFYFKKILCHPPWISNGAPLRQIFYRIAVGAWSYSYALSIGNLAWLLLKMCRDTGFYVWMEFACSNIKWDEEK